MGTGTYRGYSSINDFLVKRGVICYPGFVYVIHVSLLSLRVDFHCLMFLSNSYYKCFHDTIYGPFVNISSWVLLH